MKVEMLRENEFPEGVMWTERNREGNDLPKTITGPLLISSPWVLTYLSCLVLTFVFLWTTMSLFFVFSLFGSLKWKKAEACLLKMHQSSGSYGWKTFMWFLSMATAKESNWEIKGLLKKQNKENLFYVEKCSVGLIISLLPVQIIYYKHRF